jgi:hypothetical protein
MTPPLVRVPARIAGTHWPCYAEAADGYEADELSAVDEVRAVGMSGDQLAAYLREAEGKWLTSDECEQLRSAVAAFPEAPDFVRRAEAMEER